VSIFFSFHFPRACRDLASEPWPSLRQCTRDLPTWTLLAHLSRLQDEVASGPFRAGDAHDLRPLVSLLDHSRLVAYAVSKVAAAIMLRCEAVDHEAGARYLLELFVAQAVLPGPSFIFVFITDLFKLLLKRANNKQRFWRSVIQFLSQSHSSLSVHVSLQVDKRLALCSFLRFSRTLNKRLLVRCRHDLDTDAVVADCGHGIGEWLLRTLSYALVSADAMVREAVTLTLRSFLRHKSFSIDGYQSMLSDFQNLIALDHCSQSQTASVTGIHCVVLAAANLTEIAETRAIEATTALQLLKDLSGTLGGCLRQSGIVTTTDVPRAQRRMVQILLDDDAVLTDVLLQSLSLVAILRKLEDPVVPTVAALLDPHTLFHAFVAEVGAGAVEPPMQLILDLLLSSETVMLTFLTQYAKLLASDIASFRDALGQLQPGRDREPSEPLPPISASSMAKLNTPAHSLEHDTEEEKEEDDQEEEETEENGESEEESGDGFAHGAGAQLVVQVLCLLAVRLEAADALLQFPYPVGPLVRLLHAVVDRYTHSVLGTKDTGR